MGSQCSFSRRGVEWWWRGAKRISLAAKFWIFWRGWMTGDSCSSQAVRGYIYKSLGSVFSEKPADWTNAFKLEISSLTYFLTCFFMDSFESRMNPRYLAETEKGMLWEPRVIESGRETAVEGFKEDEKGKRRASSSTNRMNLQTAVTCLFKFADDMALVGLLLNEDSLAAYFSHVSLLNEWCEESFLEINVGKTKELVLDAKKTFFFICSSQGKQWTSWGGVKFYVFRYFDR